MKHQYLEVTYRRGRPLAAYLYLPRNEGSKVARTDDAGPGMRVDFDAAGVPMGIEITAPSVVRAEDVNALLGRLGHPDVSVEELAPLRAA